MAKIKYPKITKTAADIEDRLSDAFKKQFNAVRQYEPDLTLKDVPVIDDIHMSVCQVVTAAAEADRFNMGDWHCGTSHCRAGWVTTMAGKVGRELDLKTDTEEAALLIYLASDPTMAQAPDFYCSEDEALEEIQEDARNEQARKREKETA